MTPEKRSTYPLERYSIRIIAIGFGLIGVLMLAVVGFGLHNLNAIRETLGDIAAEHNQHAASAYRMYADARDRTHLLHSIIFDSDPFSQDQKIQRFTEKGREFGEARARLLTFRLVPAEMALLDAQREYTAVAVKLQQEVIDLALAGRREDANRLLLEKAIPAQDRVLEVLNGFFVLQAEEARSKTATATIQQKEAYDYLLAGGASAVISAILIALFVGRRMSGLMTQLDDTTQKLEQNVRDLESQKQALDEHAIVSITDTAGRITYVNKKFCQVSQYTAEELLGQDHRLLNSGYHSKMFFAGMWQAIGNGLVWHGEVCNRKKDGSFYWVETTIAPVLDASGKPYQYVSIRTEVTQIKEAERLLRHSKEELENLVHERTAELKEREEVLRLITSAAHDAIVMVDDSGNATFWNEAAETIFGYAREEMIGRNPHDFIAPQRYQESYREEFARFTQNGEGTLIGKTVEVEALRKNGAEFFVEISLSGVQISGKRYGIWIARDITDRKRAEEILKTQATTDTLTGIANRRKFDSILKTEMRRVGRYHLPLAVIMLDIDHFKRVNDTFGHQAGDSVLVELTRLISGEIRAQDFFARWGGEEFIILAPNCDVENIRLFAEKLRSDVESHDFPDIGRLTCSFGLTEHLVGESAETFIGRADVALYQAKANGRNRVESA